MKPKVYLAGKIAKNDWRGRYARPYMNEFDDAWEDVECDDFIVTGPFFVGCDHGCTHGEGTHAATSRTGCATDSRYTVDSIRRVARNKCIDAIKRSDVVFAWLDDYTAYGTLFEIGYAVALKKKVIIAYPHCPNGCDADGEFVDHCGHGDAAVCDCILRGQMWFAVDAADVALPADDAHDALRRVVASWRKSAERRALVESMTPPERQFWQAAQRPQRLSGVIHGLVPQYKVNVGGSNYRLDFAVPYRKLCFEIDGLAYHNGQDSFMRDRKRERDLQMAGWRVLRFAAKEVMSDPAKCVNEAAAWAAKA